MSGLSRELMPLAPVELADAELDAVAAAATLGQTIGEFAQDNGGRTLGGILGTGILGRSLGTLAREEGGQAVAGVVRNIPDPLPFP